MNPPHLGDHDMDMRRMRSTAAIGAAGLLMAATAAAQALDGQSAIGPGAGARGGAAVAFVGDLNGDGNPDFVVGSPDYLGDAGHLQAIAGGTGAALWTLVGTALEELGESVAGIGDLNGDGVPDVAAGAPGHNGGRGRVLLLNGATGATLFASNGTAAGHRKGHAVAAAGDLTGDGVPDVLVGVPGWFSNSGLVDLIDGSDGSVDRSWGGVSGSQLGWSVAGGYDLNGDGVNEVVLGAPSASVNATLSGTVYVKSGAGGDLFSKNGSGAYDRFGWSVALIPDTTGGSKPTLLCGAIEPGTFGGVPPGTGYVKAYDTDVATGYAVVRLLTGDYASDRFGSSLAFAGDVDQDGTADFVVGAPQIPLTGTAGEGYVRVYSGATGGVLASRGGANLGDQFGLAVAGGADADGDGLWDFVVGAPGFDVFVYADIGRTQVFHPRATSELRRVLLTEVFWGEPDGAEVGNFTGSTVSLTGWKIRWRSGGFDLSIPLSGTLAPGAVAVVHEPTSLPPGEIPAGTAVTTAPSAISGSTIPISVALVAPSGLVVDEVRVSDWTGGGAPPQLGGLFRGTVVRDAAAVGAERVWGLDSNAGADWTSETTRSFGLRSRSSGPRGTDPLPVAAVALNEIQALSDAVELKNLGAAPVDLMGWQFASYSYGPGVARAKPFYASTPIAAGGFVVLGEGAPPAGLPANVPYVDVGGGEGFDFYVYEPFACALYDAHGRCVDYVAGADATQNLAPHGPEIPHATADWTGLAPASGTSPTCVARAAAADANSGGDWRRETVATFGFDNGPFDGPTGLATPLDVRVDRLPTGNGMSIVVDAGPAYAGSTWNCFVSTTHGGGAGPFFGLGLDAFQNWLNLLEAGGLFAALDARGSARFDLAAPLGGLAVDAVFFLLDPAFQFGPRTAVVAFDG